MPFLTDAFLIINTSNEIVRNSLTPDVGPSVRIKGYDIICFSALIANKYVVFKNRSSFGYLVLINDNFIIRIAKE